MLWWLLVTITLVTSTTANPSTRSHTSQCPLGVNGPSSQVNFYPQPQLRPESGSMGMCQGFGAGDMTCCMVCFSFLLFCFLFLFIFLFIFFLFFFFYFYFYFYFYFFLFFFFLFIYFFLDCFYSCSKPFSSISGSNISFLWFIF